MPSIFDSISDWLLIQALGDEALETVVGALAQRLLDGGVPIARISIGRTVLHPIIGLMDVQWDRDNDKVTSSQVPRSVIRTELHAQHPFTVVATDPSIVLQARLSDPAEAARFEIFQKLATEGHTDYIAAARRFGYTQDIYDHITSGFRGAAISFATKRFSGFSDTDRAGLLQIITPHCASIKAATDRFIAAEVLEAYLGRISGRKVLEGQIERGDAQQIDCAILYSDLRGSVALSRDLDPKAYLDTVNAYFDCTANAVVDHGGEVLKFIGDGVLAIFPFDDETRPRARMCGAALASAREALARADHMNLARADTGLPPLQFGIALHQGSVLYGNVGTPRRLDFTATGPAVGLASRIEALTRELNVPLIATADFATDCADPATPLTARPVRDFGDAVELVTYPAS